VKEENKVSKVKFMIWDCDVSVTKYSNGNTALQLWNEEEGPIATATVNMGDKLPKDQAYIKDYSENEGMLEALADAGIVKEVIGWKASGFVTVPLCTLDLDKCRG
jgi:hypothetical protein